MGQNQAFFDLPQATKDSLAYVSSRANRGYLSLGREQASLSTDKDQIAGERVEANDQKVRSVFVCLSHAPSGTETCILERER